MWMLLLLVKCTQLDGIIVDYVVGKFDGGFEGLKNYLKIEILIKKLLKNENFE